MKKYFWISAILLLFLIGCAEKQLDASGFYFATEMPEGEGTPKYKAVEPLDLYSDCTVTAPIVMAKCISANSEIQYSQLRFIITSPVLFKITKIHDPKVINRGKISFLSRNDYYGGGKREPAPFKAGDTVWYVMSRAEGYVFVEYNGTIYETQLEGEKDGVSLIDTWAHITANNTTSGWVHLAYGNVEELSRQPQGESLD